MPHITHPPRLRPGDRIGVMAPSSRVARADLDASAALLTARGYRVFIHPQCDAALNQSAGTPAQKRDALHDLAADPDIAAVFFATGGNRALTFIDLLDYALIAAHPKIYMGFSDNTALLNAITARTGLVTYHGPTFKRLARNPELDFNLRLLEGGEDRIDLAGARILRDGKARGPLLGGNLALFRSLDPHRDYIAPDGAILFLEDIGEELSRIDRDLCVLRRSGLLGKISGLILGQFSDTKDSGTPFGFTLEDIVAEHTGGLSIPIVIDAPFGHADHLPVFPVGATATLDTSTLTLEL